LACSLPPGRRLLPDLFDDAAELDHGRDIGVAGPPPRLEGQPAPVRWLYAR
jgi:hypothetical protein